MRAIVTLEDLGLGVAVSTDGVHRIRVLRPKLRVRLAIDPGDARSRDDRFTLRGFAADGSGRYEQIRTVRDDLVPGDASVDLVFDGLLPGLSYSLEVDPGADGDPYRVFEGLGWAKLATMVYRA